MAKRYVFGIIKNSSLTDYIRSVLDRRAASHNYLHPHSDNELLYYAHHD